MHEWMVSRISRDALKQALVRTGSCLAGVSSCHVLPVLTNRVIPLSASAMRSETGRRKAPGARTLVHGHSGFPDGIFSESEVHFSALPDCVTLSASLRWSIEIVYLSGSVMNGHSESREVAVEFLNAGCERLFDIWCESRSVIPLSYLLHCWPLPDWGHASVKKLSDGLRELRMSNPDALGGRVRPILGELTSCIDEILLYPRICLPPAINDMSPVESNMYVM
ncbi:hypothetical protein [Paraburkholderia sp. BL6669N2]|uniref:hypothetical protein n=1 Tax=Paraburkholderia sp. BL6669N2 TaxID=1938807 RepID=UPI0021615EF1|nr:hypothetical protein [Paraburkholderia sp. BL6669N2]